MAKGACPGLFVVSDNLYTVKITEQGGLGLAHDPGKPRLWQMLLKSANNGNHVAAITNRRETEQAQSMWCIGTHG